MNINACGVRVLYVLTHGLRVRHVAGWTRVRTCVAMWQMHSLLL